MNYDIKALYKFTKLFSLELKRKKFPDKYHLKYIELYSELNGTKGYINYDDIAFLWGVNKEQASYYINKFKEYEVLDKTQQTNISTNNNKGYLFIIPLVHPPSIK